MQAKSHSQTEQLDKKKFFADPYYSEERPEEGSDLGAIMVHHGVIAVISRLAAMRVQGVVDMGGSFANGIANMIGKSNEERGVKVDLQGQKVNIEINIVIEYGIKIPQVAWRVQNEVRRAVEEMTGKKVGTVDVVIQGVRMPSETIKEGGKT
jgi:uncharacterized alkaline shock family protein YloU